jgi:hypothetical protein
MTVAPLDYTLPEPTVMIVPWHDPVVDTIGYDVRSTYVELFWLNVLGPTATWLIRRLVFGLDRYPLGYELDLEETAGSLGLSFAVNTACPFARAVSRCVMFGAAQPLDGAIAVRRKLPPVARRHLNRMPQPLRESHAAWTIRRTTLDSSEARRAALLADVMVEAGDDSAAIERQLLALGVAPDVAVSLAAHSAGSPIDAA